MKFIQMTTLALLLVTVMMVTMVTVAFAHTLGPAESTVTAEAAIGTGAAYVRVLETEAVEAAVAEIGSAIARYVEAMTPRPPPPAPRRTDPAPVRAASGGSGGHSDAWWQGVAMCEQGGRNDPYFGYFSFMDGSQGGKPWADQVAAGNALLARAGREVGPWAAACVAAGYRASPGG